MPWRPAGGIDGQKVSWPFLFGRDVWWPPEGSGGLCRVHRPSQRRERHVTQNKLRRRIVVRNCCARRSHGSGPGKRPPGRTWSRPRHNCLGHAPLAAAAFGNPAGRAIDQQDHGGDRPSRILGDAAGGRAARADQSCRSGGRVGDRFRHVLVRLDPADSARCRPRSPGRPGRTSRCTPGRPCRRSSPRPQSAQSRPGSTWRGPCSPGRPGPPGRFALGRPRRPSASQRCSCRGAFRRLIGRARSPITTTVSVIGPHRRRSGRSRHPRRGQARRRRPWTATDDPAAGVGRGADHRGTVDDRLGHALGRLDPGPGRYGGRG